MVLLRDINRKTTDMVTSVRVLTTTGYSNQKYNTADVENKGIEATLNGTPIKNKDFNLYFIWKFSL